MKFWLALTAAIGTGIGLWWLSWRSSADVTDTWLREQAQRENRAGFEGVAWKWPVRKDAA